MTRPEAGSGRALALWGGHECTINRVWDRWLDQSALSGHDRRLDDLDRFAELGLTALRYPVLWEKVAPTNPAIRDFAWHDERLARLRALGVRPIVGLIHHGSGPSYTSLLDDGFAAGLAAHARATAERYPWVTDWTPVNEPVTTARFSCLYGFWYPHLFDEGAFWRALINQIDATRVAMREIRRVQPAARLIQTDDLGFAHSADPACADQAAFENDRRWAGWDLLCGRLTPGHPLWDRIAGFGLADRLRAIADDPCPPDVLGVNYYLSSERVLDRPEACGEPPAGDGAPWANRCAARHAPGQWLGPQAIIEQAWARYGISVAVTEAHNGCSREEQLRWFHRMWTAAERARANGAEVEAVTAWSLLGAYGWDRLVTGGGRYEPGVFDVSGGAPRPTAMVPLLQALARGEHPPLPRLLAARGWWEQDRPHAVRLAVRDRPILITGRTGTLGQRLAEHCRLRNLPFVLTGRETLPLHDAAAMAAALDRIEPWAVINTAGLVDLDRAEREPDLCSQLNADAPARLAELCAARGLRFATISTDQVFDGAKGGPYAEDDATAPLNAYGRAKAEAEQRVLAAMPGALVARTAAFFSPHDRWNFAVHVVDALSAGRPFRAAADSFVSPTYVPDLADALIDLTIDGADGIWHLANPGRVSWAEFARLVADARGLDAGLIEAVPSSELGWLAPRPADVALTSVRGAPLPPLEHGVERFAAYYVPLAHPAAGIAAE